MLKLIISHPSFRRIIEIGFTPGQEIELVNKSIFNDPLAFSLRGTMIAIRKHEAESIQIIMSETIIEELPLITLVGPPNSGKTTLFNYLSGKNFKTVNYPGSTIEYNATKFQEKI